MDCSLASRNERWTAVAETPLNDAFGSHLSAKTMGTSTANNPARKKKTKSRNLRSMLRQDFMGKNKPSSLPQQPLVRPSRKASVECLQEAPIYSVDSMSTISSSESLSDTANKNSRWKSPATSKNNLLKYTNRESRGSLLSLNNRWRATPKTSNRKVDTTLSSSLGRGDECMNIPNVSATGKRWMASVSSDKHSDRPIGLITRKSSAAYLPATPTVA